MDRNFTSQRLAHIMTNMGWGRGMGGDRSKLHFKDGFSYRDRHKFPVPLLY